jgi:radical SAM family uncharacterized protein
VKSLNRILWTRILPQVQKPTRYTGNEINATRKDHRTARVKVALAFPDLYEVGMSHLGLKILYHIINAKDDWLAERVFMPDTDFEGLMRQEEFPLCSLETTTPLADFDLLGFTLQYELSYATILRMLQLSGIPVLAAERGENDPLVAGGGPGAFNPEPVSSFFDFLVIGDAEEALPEALNLLAGCNNHPRADKLSKLATITGVYVPSLYRAGYAPDGRFLGTTPLGNRPTPVQRAVVRDLETVPYPTDFIVPYGVIVHDRLVLELFRGCTRGCRFCQAGIIYRPVRERSPGRLKELAVKMVRATGYDEIALSSLSSSDYSNIKPLVEELSRDMSKERISLSLPSLRLDSFSVDLAEQVQRVRKSGLTFAPEAGSQRLRDVINKNVTEDDLLSTVQEAFRLGWSNVKLYFMIGLPTETDEDLREIAALARKVLKVCRDSGGRGRPRVTVSASVFVPKPHTPFQWVGQISKEEIFRRQALLKAELRGPGLNYQWHGAEASLLEAALARGGRNLNRVIHRAFELGCKLDGWDEHFSFSSWQQAFAGAGLDLEMEATRDLDPEAPLPWDHLDSGVSKKYLLREYRRALSGQVTADCRGSCLGCGMAVLLAGCGEKEPAVNADLD